MRTKSIVALASCGAALITAAGAARGVTYGHSCPCGPIGTPVTKWECQLPNGDVFKEICTNQSTSGNFVTTYCHADGTSHQVGECIYYCGENYFCFVYDDDGELCYVIHKNYDDDDHDNDTHQLKVYTYNVKTRTLTTTCYKRNTNGTYKPVGRPTCTTPATYAKYPTPEAQYAYFNRLAFPDGDPRTDVTGPIMPQLQQGVALIADGRATGSRDVHFGSDGAVVTIGVGDRITLYGVNLGEVSNVHPMFVATPADGGAGVDLVAIGESPLANDEMIVRIDRSMAGTPVQFRAMTAGDPAFAAMIDQYVCAEVAMDATAFAQRSISGFGQFDAPVLMDLNSDGRIGAHDLAMVLADWGGNHGLADLSGDGWVNAVDVGLLLSHWGMSDEE